MHLYHCHSTPLKKHIHKGLYGAFIIDPPEPRKPAQELVMVMNGYDTDGDGGNNFYTVNGRSFYYAKYPITVRRSQTVRIYLANLTEFDLINSFHLHGDFFRYYPTGSSDLFEYTDTVVQCQGQRGIIEIDFANTGLFMFHAHQSEFAELGWMGYFNVVEWRRAVAREQPGRPAGDCWALVPIVLLVAVVSVFAAAGGSLDRPGRATNPPPADEFDIRRVEFQPGEIRIRVTNPQQDDLTIASVTVDDAIVPVQRRRAARRWAGSARARSSSRTTGSRTSRSRSASRARPGSRRSRRSRRPWRRPGASAEGVLGYGRSASSSASSRSRSACSGCRRSAAPRRSWLAAFMALTAGLLSFLAVEALSEALELQAALPGALGGAGLVLLGVALSYLTMTFISQRFSRAAGAPRAAVGGLALATLVAIGIGLHNFGEGLAIGSSFALGELALGTFLIVGFMIHNVTEGLGIAAPIAEGGDRAGVARLAAPDARRRRARDLRRLARRLRGSELLGVVFFAAASAPPLEVVVEVGRYVARRAPGGLDVGLRARRLPRRHRRHVRDGYRRRLISA